ncbi:xanthine dehydrogenase family protein molybdopterin-binding subunit [Pseudonocardia xishanensis]|uniref:Xanthine dehydrogenase family protein molybdopterin-binding subunit n=1 Tax=Pseudonocardia xishanensis TaxID=630995 RepID=A0ABP8S1Q2_9PSEU
MVAVEPMAPVATAESPAPYIGRKVLRSEDPRFLTGRARYTDDVAEPVGLLHAAFLRSPHAHARIVSIDASRALGIDGVEAVYTQAEVSGVLGDFTTTLPMPEVKTITRPILNSTRAYWVGQPIAVVLGTSRYTAEDGVDALDVEWEILEPLMDAELLLTDPQEPMHDAFPDNNFAHIEYQMGDVDELFAKAAHTFSKRFHQGRYMAAPLEPRGVMADFDPSTGELTVWSSTQVPHFMRSLIAGPLGIPESTIRVIADNVGGGFGMKCHVFDEEAIVPAVSKLSGRPVKWIEDRYENLAASSHAKETVCYLEAAVDEAGTLLALRGRFIGIGGAWPSHPWTSLVDTVVAAQHMPMIYDLKAVGYTVDTPVTNRCPTGAYRGVGWTVVSSARETFVDEIARELDIDPVEFRLRNCIPDRPFTTVTGQTFDGGSYQGSLRKVREMLDYDAFRKRQAELREQGRYIGLGLCAYVEPTAWGSDIAVQQGFKNAAYFDAASVTMEPDGSVTVTTGMHCHGQAHETTLAQVAADTIGVTLESVRVIENDTARAVYGMGTWGSRSAVIGGGAIMRAGRDVKANLQRMAGRAMEVAPEDIEISQGVASVAGMPSRSMTVAEVAAFAYYGGDSRPDGHEPALTATRSYDPDPAYSNGTFAAIVEVDPQTGEVTIEKMVICEDCGVIINPMIVDGQIAGGVAQGIGGAMFEDLVYDGGGQFVSGSLMEYLYPSATEVPPMEISHIETASPVTEGGIKGMGEAGALGGVPVLNAVADALSPFGTIVIEKAPLRPCDVLELIERARAAGPAT